MSDSGCEAHEARVANDIQTIRLCEECPLRRSNPILAEFEIAAIKEQIASQSALAKTCSVILGRKVHLAVGLLAMTGAKNVISDGMALALVGYPQ